MTTINCWKLVSAAIGNADRILLYGPPGTGKTYAAATESLDFVKYPDTEDETKVTQDIYQVTMTEDTASANLEGFYKPNSSGAFDWHDGIAIQAWRNGGRLVVNEIDHASPDAMTFMHAILDDKEIARLTLNNDKKETVKPAEGFQVIATTNSLPESLPMALKDRFPVQIHVDKIHPKAISIFPQSWHEIIEETSLSQDTEERLSIRAWREFFELMDKGLTKDEAGFLIFGDRANDLVDAITLTDADLSIEEDE